jgi:hypothetical protein
VNPTIVRAGDISPFTFMFTPGTGWTTAVSTVIVTFPIASGVSVPAGGVLECGFGNYQEASSCVVTSAAPLVITVTAPFTTALTIG